MCAPAGLLLAVDVPQPPETRKQAIVDRIHSIGVADPYLLGRGDLSVIYRLLYGYWLSTSGGCYAFANRSRERRGFDAMSTPPDAGGCRWKRREQ